MRIPMILGLLILGLSGGTAWAADTTDAKVHQDVHQLKKDYQKKIDKELKGISKGIRHLEHQAAKADTQVKTDINKEVIRLKVQKKEADKKFDDLKHSAGDAWKDLRQGVDDAVADLKRGVDAATEKFKEKK